jgi:thermitase
MLGKTSLLLVVLCLVFSQDACYSQLAQEQAYVPGQILVKFNDGVSQDKALEIHNRLGSTMVKHFEKISVYLVQIKPGVTVEEAIDLYQEDPNVAYAEPNYTRRMQTKKSSATP